MLCIAICTFIFSNSLRNGDRSSAQSEAVLAMVNGLLGEIGSFRVAGVWIRKAAHFIEFAALGASLGYTLRWWVPRLDWRTRFFAALGMGVFCAALDEFIQLFSPGRAAQISDVLLDSAGVLTGALLVAAFYQHWMRRGMEKRG